jgi:DNA topoisomerase-1
MTTKPYIERRRLGRGFQYFYHGQEVKDKESLAYFKSLRIPPAWKDVQIFTHRQGKIQAIGFDSAGRAQYIYSPAFRAKQEKEKFERILRFARALPHMRRATSRHLNERGMGREKVLACIVQLMDQEYFRVGNEVYAEENQSYGLTTLRRKHIDIKGDTVTFDFIGKSGKHQHKEVTDKDITKIIKKLDDLPGYEIFKYIDNDGNIRNVDSAEVNEYIKEIMGDEFTAKDFRTWGGTLWATAELAAAEKAETENDRKKNVNLCVRKVAARLGNTPAIARSSYIDPRIINAYIKGQDLAKVQAAVAKIRKENYLTNEESCVLKLLET